LNLFLLTVTILFFYFDDFNNFWFFTVLIIVISDVLILWFVWQKGNWHWTWKVPPQRFLSQGKVGEFCYGKPVGTLGDKTVQLISFARYRGQLSHNQKRVVVWLGISHGAADWPIVNCMVMTNCEQSNTVRRDSTRMCWCKLSVWFSPTGVGSHGEWCPRKCFARQ